MPLAEIKPHPRNPRKHPDPGSEEWEIVKKSLDTCYFEPLTVNLRNGMLVSGHLRWKVMLDMGIQDAHVSVIDCDEQVHYALMVHANRHQGEFDPQILAALLAEIEVAGIDAALAGFDHEAMMALIRPPEPEDDTEQTEELLSKADLLQQKWLVVMYGWKHGAAHHWQGGFSQSTLLDDQVDLKKKSKPELIEIINGLRNALETSVIREPRNTGNGLHPTVKPVRLVSRHIWNSSQRGETVLELFGGSGTTLAASEQLGRSCVATELKPEYCAVILERLTALGLGAEKVHGPQ